MLSGDSTQESLAPSLNAPTFYKSANKFTSKFAKELRRSHMSRIFLNILASFVLNSKHPDRDFFVCLMGFMTGFQTGRILGVVVESQNQKGITV
jgi:hypothetical protein